VRCNCQTVLHSCYSQHFFDVISSVSTLTDITLWDPSKSWRKNIFIGSESWETISHQHQPQLKDLLPEVWNQTGTCVHLFQWMFLLSAMGTVKSIRIRILLLSCGHISLVFSSRVIPVNSNAAVHFTLKSVILVCYLVFHSKHEMI